MKRLFSLPLAAALVFAAGCIPSLNAPFHKKDVVFDKRLLGVFEDSMINEEHTWRFKRRNDTSYDLIMERDGDVTGEMHAHLFKLKDSLYLDIFAEHDHLEEKVAPWYWYSLIPAHMFFKVREIGDELALSAPDLHWFDAHIKNHPDALAHIQGQQRFIVTASTDELQQFLLKHEDKFWAKPQKMVRRK